MANTSTFIDHTGTPRKLGLARRARPHGLYAPHFNAADLIPQSQWSPFAVNIPSTIKRKDQQQTNACVANSRAGQMMLARDQAGMSLADLDAYFIYPFIDGGIDEGADPADALTIGQTLGCSSGSVPFGTILSNQISAAARTDALRFRIDLADQVATPEQLMSATLRQCVTSGVVWVGDGFDTFDADGVPTLDFTQQPNHCVTFGRGVKLATKGVYKGQWLVTLINSWGESWGQDGLAWVPISIASSFGWYGDRIVAMRNDPLDTGNPVPMAA